MQPSSKSTPPYLCLMGPRKFVCMRKQLRLLQSLSVGRYIRLSGSQLSRPIFCCSAGLGCLSLPYRRIHESHCALHWAIYGKAPDECPSLDT